MRSARSRSNSTQMTSQRWERAVPAGAAAEDRYPEPPMAILDSERA